MFSCLVLNQTEAVKATGFSADLTSNSHRKQSTRIDFQRFGRGNNPTEIIHKRLLKCKVHTYTHFIKKKFLCDKIIDT